MKPSDICTRSTCVSGLVSFKQQNLRNPTPSLIEIVPWWRNRQVHWCPRVHYKPYPPLFHPNYVWCHISRKRQWTFLNVNVLEWHSMLWKFKSRSVLPFSWAETAMPCLLLICGTVYCQKMTMGFSLELPPQQANTTVALSFHSLWCRFSQFSHLFGLVAYGM